MVEQHNDKSKYAGNKGVKAPAPLKDRSKYKIMGGAILTAFIIGLVILASI